MKAPWLFYCLIELFASLSVYSFQVEKDEEGSEGEGKERSLTVENTSRVLKSPRIH